MVPLHWIVLAIMVIGTVVILLLNRRMTKLTRYARELKDLLLQHRAEAEKFVQALADAEAEADDAADDAANDDDDAADDDDVDAAE